MATSVWVYCTKVNFSCNLQYLLTLSNVCCIFILPSCPILFPDLYSAKAFLKSTMHIALKLTLNRAQSSTAFLSEKKRDKKWERENRPAMHFFPFLFCTAEVHTATSLGLKKIMICEHHFFSFSWKEKKNPRGDNEKNNVDAVNKRKKKRFSIFLRNLSSTRVASRKLTGFLSCRKLCLEPSAVKLATIKNASLLYFV